MREKRRINILSKHTLGQGLPVSSETAKANSECCQIRAKKSVGNIALDAADALEVPVVQETALLKTDPIKFMMEAKRQHPDMFVVQRKGFRFLVLGDFHQDLFEDVLTDVGLFGEAQTSNMMVSENVFRIPREAIDKFELPVIKKLRAFLNKNSVEVTDVMGRKMKELLRETLFGSEGVIDLRELSNLIFWPMTQTLFGSRCSKEIYPDFLKLFWDIDDNFGIALRGIIRPEVTAAVEKATEIFHEAIKRNDMGYLGKFYLEEVKDAKLAAMYCVSAWWGGLGNTLPSAMWTLAHILTDPRVRQKAYADVDAWDGVTLNSKAVPYVSACFNETLRMKTWSVSWREVKDDCLVPSQSGKCYKLPKGLLVGVHWVMRHFDDTLHDDVLEFKPERFEGLDHPDGGKQFSWAPFGRGVHKCSGYGLASVEVPTMIAIFLKMYDLRLLDPLPDLDWSAAFGVIGAKKDQPMKMEFRKRAQHK